MKTGRNSINLLPVKGRGPMMDEQKFFFISLYILLPF
jgi:hypothetical protein